MRVASFAEIESDFLRLVSRIVWCTVTTIDPQGRPRSRILHPVWEGPTGWIATGRHSAKAGHLAAHPVVAVCYWDPAHEQIYAECTASWEDRPAERARVWHLFKTTPPPLGYDPGMFWAGPEDAAFGALRLQPWRIELSSLADMMNGKPSRVWRP